VNAAFTDESFTGRHDEPRPLRTTRRPPRRDGPLIQYGVTVRARDWDERGRVVRDYAVESEPEPQWYLRTLEENRQQYGPLIEAEKIPDEYLLATDADWQ
jgi:hypothetical protein